jgi:hypothetical protein
MDASLADNNAVARPVSMTMADSERLSARNLLLETGRS